MDELKLLPCPFCGEEKAQTDKGVNGYFVTCTNCKSNSGSYSEIGKAVKAWNTRIKPRNNRRVPIIDRNSLNDYWDD